jgi:hypothetical protein
LTLIALVASASACATNEEKADPFPYDELSEFGLFDGPLAELVPAEGVVPYEVRSELWADNAFKRRFIQLPPGSRASATSGEDWEFPVGTVVVKNFGFFADMRDP